MPSKRSALRQGHLREIPRQRRSLSYIGCVQPRRPSALVGAVSAALIAGACAQNVSTSSPLGALTAAGWSFGLCLGPCQAELDVSGEELTYVVKDRTGTTVFAQNRGQLTPRAVSRLNDLVAALPADLPATFGCPDCADGGLGYLTIARPGETRRSDYEYPNPPSELAALDGFVKGVMDAIGACHTTTDVVLLGDCTPVPR
jgi:hypothetical protein